MSIGTNPGHHSGDPAARWLFSGWGHFSTYGYGFGNGGIGVVGALLIILVVLLLTG